MYARPWVLSVVQKKKKRVEFHIKRQVLPIRLNTT